VDQCVLFLPVSNNNFLGLLIPAKSRIHGSMSWSFDFLIVGAGFAGCVLAERLAGEGKRCLIVERRAHIGGNSNDEYDDAGVLIHSYGPHYFRSNSDAIVRYLSRFTEWHPVDYKILSWSDGQYWPFPINLNTFEQLVGHPATSGEMQDALAKWRVPVESPRNSEEVIISQVGVQLYEKFFKNYTRKQWKLDPSQLDASVCGRIPVRTNRDDRYLVEKFQALPKHGYAKLFQRLVDHPAIQILLKTDYRDVLPHLDIRHMVYTGPIDAFYDFRFGPLPYRSLRFERETLEKEFFQPAMQVNYPNDHDFTRIVEIKHATGQRLPVTTIVREYPADYTEGSEPFYPIPNRETHALYERYAALAQSETKVSFVGRLATYRYYNMDQVVAAALTEFEKLKARGLC
jgi:UDP-galactopyranose mutase